MTGPTGNSRAARYSCEALFALNIAVVAKLQGNQMPNAVFSFHEIGQFVLQVRINTLLHLHPHNRVGGEAAFFIYAVMWALIIFVALRFLSHSVAATQFLRWAAGIISLLALPISWLFVGTAPTLPDPTHPLLVLELILATAFAVLYQVSKWPFPTWSTVFILALHFALWGWLLAGGIYFWLDPLRPSVAVSGFAATLAWGRYISRQGGERLSGTEL
jgi:hypothetical protein